MNIGFFTNIYLPTISGVVTIIENYRKELEKQGHKVYIFAAKKAGYKDDNSKVFRYKSIDLNYKISYPLPIVYSWRIGKIIKRLNLDIIHTHHFFICGQIAWYYAKKLNVPLVFTHHTRYEFYTHYVPLLPEEISKPLALSLCAFFANSCDTIIAPTQDIKNLLLINKVKKPIIILPSGIDLDRFNKAKREVIRKKYNIIAENKIILLTVSRLAPEKNISFLLKSFKKIVKNNPDVLFMIVGDGPLKKDLEKEAENLGIKEKIIFTDNVSQQEIPFYYKAADVFIFSSFSEVQPTVITEAMATGLPVVAIEAYGVKDVIKNKENGFLVSNNLQEFSQAVLELTNNETLRENISQKAKATAKEFSVENATKKLVGIYEKLIAEKKKGLNSGIKI